MVSTILKERILRILREFRQKSKLEKHGLTHRRKILLVGPPDTGKTLTASILASELKLPLYTILLDTLVTKYMGETSAKLRLVFDVIPQRTGVYFFDEFDAIGGERPWLQKWNKRTRYSLIVSLHTPEEHMDVYTPVAAALKTPITINA